MSKKNLDWLLNEETTENEYTIMQGGEFVVNYSRTLIHRRPIKTLPGSRLIYDEYDLPWINEKLIVSFISPEDLTKVKLLTYIKNTDDKKRPRYSVDPDPNNCGLNTFKALEKLPDHVYDLVKGGGVSDHYSEQK